MGKDKGRLRYSARAQADVVAAQLAELCVGVLVSVSPDQAREGAYAGHSCVIDEVSGRGPAGGLLAAWRHERGSALLVVAVDMPLIDLAMLERLVEARDTSKAATAYRHPDGTLEPLCTIWEPAAEEAVRHELESGKGSLRFVLESSDVSVLTPAEPFRLESVDTAERFDELRGQIAAERKEGVRGQ